ncbi:MAG: amidohydrolase family protein, partial [Firmicutes bacterium]|nr:amidohydrolase family protein [Bacillota bacterium]
MKTSIDKLFFGKNIYTMVAENDKVEAVAVKDGKIVFAGERAQAEELYEAAEVIELTDEQAMLPGFGDSHLHFYAYCQNLTNVDLAGSTTKVEAMKRLADKAAETPEGTWIKGTNFDQSKWKDCEDQIPTKDDLDAVSTKHPIVIKRCCLHTVVANSMALEMAGIGKGYVFGVGGTVELDEEGMPNGIFREQASKVYDEMVPDPLTDPAVKKELMVKALKDVSSKGVTMLHTYAAEIWKYTEDFDDYQALDDEGLLPVRMTICLDELFDKPELTEEQKADPNRKVQMGTYKIFTDGSLGSRSAALMEPYADDPTTCGIMVIGQDDLNEKTWKGYERG